MLEGKVMDWWKQATRRVKMIGYDGTSVSNWQPQVESIPLSGTGSPPHG